MIRVDDLHVRVGDKDIIRGVDLYVPDGELHALFGPNGTGKSVLLSALMGYPQYETVRGRIELCGRDLTGLPIHERARLGLGMAEQRPPTVKGVRLRDLVDLIVPPDSPSRPYAEEAADRYGVRRFFDRAVNDGLSGGESKCAELYLLLIGKPRFVILDEPDSGVDPEHLKIIAAMIRECVRGDPSAKAEPGPDGSPGRRLELPPCMVHNAGLLVTHSAAILEYLPVDRAHLLLDGRVRCSGNPRILMERIKERGYEQCVRCGLEGEHHGA